MWTHEVEPAGDGAARRVRLFEAGQLLSYGHALHLLAESAPFRQHLSQLLAGDARPAFRWETPPITRLTLGRAFEYVLTDDRSLDTTPDPVTFGKYFTGEHATAAVRAVPNLGNTAMLVPRPVGEAGAYPHLARFLRHAPAAQVHALWQCLAAAARRRLSRSPQWISTAGRGIAWLHVRIDDAPKYYRHRPYARAD